MKKSILSTKAKTLASLQNIIKSAKILPQYCFDIKNWKKDKSVILEQINLNFGKNIPKIVRSSSSKEDSSSVSLAGYFKSEINVITNEEMIRAINNVIKSYGENVNDFEEVLVQPMLEDSKMSGVAFSHDPSTGSAYKVINYIIGSDTAAVTSGAVKTKTFVYFKIEKGNNKNIDKVAELIEELENIFTNTPLDIEFALSKKIYCIFYRLDH